MRHPFRILFAAAVLVAALSSATVALAASSSWQRVDVTVQSEQTGAVMLISGTLPEKTKLPAQAELSVPAGSEIQWIGEILGGDQAADPTLEYTKVAGKDADIYRFTLTKARTAQVELQSPSSIAFDGSTYAPSVAWTATQDVPEVRLTVRVPEGAQLAKEASGASVEPGPTGFSYYSKTTTDVKAGEQLTLDFAYTAPLGTAGTAKAGTAAADSTSGIVLAVGVLLVAAVSALVITVRRQGARATRSAAGTSAGDSPAAEGATGSAKSSSLVKPLNTVSPHSAGASRPRKNMLPAIVVLAVVGAIVAGALAAGTGGTSAKVVGGKLTKTFGTAAPCTAASVSLVANEGVDLAKKGEALLEVFTGQEGITDATLDIERSVLEIGYCESQQTPESISGLLAGSGLVTVAQVTPKAVSAPATETP